MHNRHYNGKIKQLITLIDKDNGEDYHKNVKTKGYLLRLPNSDTQMLYQLKIVDNIKVLYIRYIHYTNRKELLNLLAFAAQWWRNLKPHIVYYKEKHRQNEAGDYLEEYLKFSRDSINNELLPFHCLIDKDTKCKCPIYEYLTYRPAEPKKGKNSHKKQKVIQ